MCKKIKKHYRTFLYLLYITLLKDVELWVISIAVACSIMAVFPAFPNELLVIDCNLL